MKKKVLITGISSKLSIYFINFIKDDYEINGITHSKNFKNKSINKTFFLDFEDKHLKNEINSSDIIIHFAWSRISKDNYQNKRLTSFLIDHKNKTTRLYFISSASIHKNALSNYARQKYEVSKIMNDYQCCNIILGIIEDDNDSQIRSISKLLKLLPFQVYFKQNIFNTYIVDINSFCLKFSDIINKEIYYKNIVIVDKILSNNELFKYVKNKYKISDKVNLKVGIHSINMVIMILKYFNSKLGFFDKILTFISKDDKWLEKLDRY
tara:strand:- start:7051 stop:7848 length:798 start_codon:yes stop_codon:yes gene_type:complete